MLNYLKDFRYNMLEMSGEKAASTPVAALPICNADLMHGRLKLAQMLHQRKDGLLLIECLQA